MNGIILEIGMTTKILFSILTAGVIVGGIIYFYRRKKDVVEPSTEIEEENETENSIIEQIELEKLTLMYVINYFKEKYGSLKDENLKMIALKINGKENPFNINVDESAEQLNFIALTFFDSDKNEILIENTRIIKTKELDSNLRDAFGEKEMIELS